MSGLVGVSFKTAGKVYYYEPGAVPVQMGDTVVVETIRGLEMGEVVPAPPGLPPEAAGKPARRIARQADDADYDMHFRNRLRAAEALRLSRERVRRHGLPMKMLDAEYTLDGNKVVLYFAAEGRVDFRALVRDLASALRKRIELHQVGARDRSALTGGLGPCGRECCCSSWIREFTPVSIKMAKEQGLSLNPSKISGSCGRLMCCLRYEYHTYRELRKELPRVGAELRIPEGKVTVVGVNLARYTLTVQHPEMGVFEVPAGRSEELAEAALCTSCSTPKVAACAPEEPRPAERRHARSTRSPVEEGRPRPPADPARSRSAPRHPEPPASPAPEAPAGRRRRRGGSGRRGLEPE